MQVAVAPGLYYPLSLPLHLLDQQGCGYGGRRARVSVEIFCPAKNPYPDAGRAGTGGLKERRLKLTSTHQYSPGAGRAALESICTIAHRSLATIINVVSPSRCFRLHIQSNWTATRARPGGCVCELPQHSESPSLREQSKKCRELFIFGGRWGEFVGCGVVW